MCRPRAWSKHSKKTTARLRNKGLGPMSDRSRNPFIAAVAFIALVLHAIPAAAQTVVIPSDAPAAGDALAAATGQPSPFDTLTFFGGLDGSKQPQDLGINANMGVRLAANLGLPLVKR